MTERLPDASASELGDVIDEVTSGVESFVGRRLARQVYRETLSGRGRLRLRLSALPVETGTVSVTVAGEVEADWRLEDPALGWLYLADGWGGEVGEVVATYTAGYLVPGVAADWTAEEAVAVGAWRRPTPPAALLAEATTAGQAGTVEPVWPAVVGETVVDGGAVWTMRAAVELPAWLRRVAAVLVEGAYTGDPGVVGQSGAGFSERYEGGGSDLPSWAERALFRLPQGAAEAFS